MLEGENGVFGAMSKGTVIVDSSTIAPAIARRLAARATELGASMLDAPVSGGEIGAIDGTLTFMVGGDAAALESVRAMLGAMGKPDRIVHVGESGAGQICKACNQIVLGGTMAVVAEAIALSRKAGVDPMKVRAALMGGFAQSRVLEVHGERMITGNWKPGFKAKLFKKDLGIAMNTLAENGVPAVDERRRAAARQRADRRRRRRRGLLGDRESDLQDGESLKRARREQVDGVTRRSIDRQVGEDLADHARELVAVPRARRGDHDVRAVGMLADHEMMIGRERVLAGDGFDQRRRRQAPAGTARALRGSRPPLSPSIGRTPP